MKAKDNFDVLSKTVVPFPMVVLVVLVYPTPAATVLLWLGMCWNLHASPNMHPPGWLNLKHRAGNPSPLAFLAGGGSSVSAAKKAKGDAAAKTQ